jgi:integrase
MEADMAGGTAKKLTDIECKAFAKKAVPGSKLADGGGLFLFITRHGGVTWRIKYRLDGKEGLYSVGPYDDISLKDARAALLDVKSLLRQHVDPVDHRRLLRTAGAAASENTFKAVAGLWLAMKKKDWSNVHFIKSQRALERDIFPTLGALPIANITAPMVALVVERVSNRGATETATRILQHIAGIFRYAQAKGLCDANPAVAAAEVLPKKRQPGQMSALIDMKPIGDMLLRARALRVAPSVHMAHRLIAFTAMRISNVVEAQWNQFHLDGDQPMWVIPRSAMKKKDTRFPAHRIPLSAPIAAELRRWRDVTGGRGYTFPSPVKQGRPITVNTVEKMYRVTLGLRDVHSPHGWRSSLSTNAREIDIPSDVVHIATDHAHDTETALRYDRGDRFSQRVKMMDWWGDKLVAAEAAASMPRAPHDDQV